MKAIITENQNIAREISFFLGTTEKKDGYLIGNEYCVTWISGHLVSLAMPEDYDISELEKSALPILPNPFKLTTRKIRKDNTYIIDSVAAQQLEVIKKVLDQCSSIIVATDASRQGELIFRNIYDYLQCDMPFERLWISSLTEKAISEGFKKLKPSEEFDLLYRGERAKSQADWLVGINASQAISFATCNDMYSLGRLETPALALICKRYLEYTSFSTEKHWQIGLNHRKEFIDFQSLSIEKWEDRKHTENILKLIEQQTNAQVKDIQIVVHIEPSPLLFNLTELQRVVNKKLGFTSEETLQIAQSLYEKKFITYPCTENRHISEDLWIEIPTLIRSLNTSHKYKKAISKLKFGNFNKHIVKNQKIINHHGLLITGKIPSALSVMENSIYEIIAFRLLESLLEPCQKEVCQITLQVSHYEFAVKGIKILELGWRSVQNIFDGQDSLQDLPQLKVGDMLKISDTQLLEKDTEAPQFYTEATLLSAMELAGIGNPTTKVSAIESLIEKNYIKREGKNIVPTDKGIHIYEIVKDMKISNVQMAAEWEFAFRQIEDGTLSAAIHHEKIEDYTTAITKELLEVNIQKEVIPNLICPKCKKHKLLINDKTIKCNDQTCSWTQFRTTCGIPFSIEDIIMLITKGRTSLIKNMKSRNGKKFDAFVILKDDFSTAFEFSNSLHSREL